MFDLRNSTEAQQVIAERGGVIDANYLISWFCFGMHEILGGVFVLPGLYLWAVAASLPQTSPLPRCLSNGWLAPVLEQTRDSTVIACCGVSLCTYAVIKGAWGFAHHTATTRLLLKWNGALGVWSWGSGDENPDGLFGVFLSSGVWVVVGLLLLLWRRNRWFLAVQLAALVGQGLGGALGGDTFELPSNFCEQLVTWSLIGLGWELSRDVVSSSTAVARGGGIQESQGVAAPLLGPE